MRKSFAICIGALSLCACNSSSDERFIEQESSYVLSLTTSELKAYGASAIDDNSGELFRCPSVSEMSSESDIAIFRGRADALLPSFTLESVNGIRSDASGGVAISLTEVPIGMLDIYMRCNRTLTDRYATSCPSNYKIVDECSSASDNLKECVLVSRGAYELKIAAEVTDDDACMTEEVDRSPYSTTTPDIAYACDAFSAMPVPAMFRGTAPLNGCCSDDKARLDFCLKPCGCRKLKIWFEPRESIELESGNTLKLAVFSNVNGNRKQMKKLLDSIVQYRVDTIISLGNLTDTGSSAQLHSAKNIIDDKLLLRDGFIEGQSCAENVLGDMCCDPGENSRLVSYLCNVLFSKIPFMTGLGVNEYEGNLTKYTELFGSSNKITTIGKVQLILLDTADGKISSQQKNWLKKELAISETQKCAIPAPTNAVQWPSLYECRKILGLSDNATDHVSCRECIGEEAYCIPPDASREETDKGPENCICVPITSKICKKNQWCSKLGEEGICQCTRDEDCGIGGTCNPDGSCAAPMRLVFTYTPPFDEYGSRNNALISKSQAVSLMSLFSKSHVAAVFSGRSNDYGKFSMANIPIYITGGGGAQMTAFSDFGHHWLYVEIPNAYTNPSPDEIKVQVVEF